MFLFTNCHKIDPTKTVITAVNESKIPLANVNITIQASSTQSTAGNGNLTNYGKTDANGQIVFDYSSIYKDGQAGVAVLDILGNIVVGNDTLIGSSYVQLQAGQTEPATIILRKKPN